MTEHTPKTNYPFPKYVLLILGNEFCERLSFYGMRAILVIYLTYFIGFDETTSTVIYHGFVVLSYLFPLVGGFMADSYWGKYRTILVMSSAYFVGSLVNCVAAINFEGNSSDSDAANSNSEDNFRTVNAIICIIGLIIMACGTGGIKPCVSALGADQFETDDTKNKTLFFDLFYWAISCGAVISTFITPIFRQMTCGSLGTEDSCYFIAFLIPAGFMFCAIILFVFGKRYYTLVPPSKSNILGKFCKSGILR